MGLLEVGGEVAHTQMRANNRVWIALEGVTTLNKCAAEEGAAARERALRRMTVAKPSYGINPQFYESFTTRWNDNCAARLMTSPFSGFSRPEVIFHTFTFDIGKTA